MKLAEKMMNIAENTLDEKLFEAFKNEALRRIENVASLGRRRHEVYFDYSAEPIFRSIASKDVYWKKLKDFLDEEGFKTELSNYQGPGRYGWALDVRW